MKRMIALVLALLLVLSAAGNALAADKTFKTPYYTLTLPDSWDSSTDDAETDEDGMEYLGFFGEDKDIGMIVESYLVYYERLKDVSLWDAGKDELEEYAEAILDDFADDEPELLDTVMAGKIPFVLMKGADEDGEYLYADTMTNGYAVIFIAYLVGPDGETQYPFSQKDIERFQSILKTFQPVS